MPPKRKRAATLPSKAVPDVAQPSIPNASGEDTADPVPDDVEEPHSNDPPAKRTRSSKTSTNGTKQDDSVPDNEPSSEPNVGGENGEAARMKMDAPPKGGILDPVGYHTNPPPEGRPVRVYADGVFDLFHLGHMRQLEQAKTAFPNTRLLVGVTGDTETHKRKGLTVLSAKERAETVRHCKWVDQVIEDCPWVITVEFLEKHQIDYVAHDDLPYGASEGDDIYKPIKEQGKFLVTQRTEGVSTTGIITKIVRDYEQYIARQLRRGTSRQELNISWLKKNELDIKRNVAELRDTIRSNWATTGQELGRELRLFWQPSRQNSPAPTPSGRRAGTPRGSEDGGSAKSPLERLSHLEIPPTPRERGGRNQDFAAGYAMGLVGGVKGWMQRNRRNLSDSGPPSPGSDEESSGKRSEDDDGRGRLGRRAEEGADARLDVEMDGRS